MTHQHLLWKAGRLAPAGTAEEVAPDHAAKLRAFGAIETEEPPAPRILPRPDPSGAEALKARLREELKEELRGDLLQELRAELAGEAAKSSRRKST